MKTIMDCRRQPKPAYFAYRNALEPVMLSLRTDRFTYYCGEQISIEAHICNDTHKCGSGKLIFELYKDGRLVKRGETARRYSRKLRRVRGKRSIHRARRQTTARNIHSAEF